jgi:hypothetical protein
LPLSDQRPFELGERAHHRQQQLRHRVVLAGETQLLLDELHPHPAPGQVADDAPKVHEISCQPIKRMHGDRVTGPREAQHLRELRTVDVLARQRSMNV